MGTQKEIKKIKVHWATLDQSASAVANALGYNAHNSAMLKACAKYFDYSPDAPIAITITPADQFKPIKGKKNILFTMWEAINVPRSYIPGLNDADLIVTPSTFCTQIFKPLTRKPVKTCFEGVDPEVFTFKERQLPDFSNGGKFRLLWLGAPNPRKGYFSIMELSKIVEKMPNVELYVKTTAHKKLTFGKLIVVTLRRLRKMFINESRFKPEKYSYVMNWVGEWRNVLGSFKRFFSLEIAETVQVMGIHKNIIFDTRKLPIKELVDLYHSAHCFLIPHAGEGWCLPLCEAMATGCPSIASYSTGVLDFFDSGVGYPIKVNIVETKMQNYNITAGVYVPDTKDFVAQVCAVMNDYREAKCRAKKASYRIRTEFTWDKAAKRLADIVEKLEQQGLN